MKVKFVVMLNIGLLIITACVSKPTKPTVSELSANDIRVAILQEQQSIVNSIVGHIGSGRLGVAVLDIASENTEIGIFATEEIIIQLVRTRRFRVVDRDSIETILREQHFQYSGVVSDDTAVSIGKFIGASIIITGAIHHRQGQIDFSLKILDVETAEIVDFISIPIWK
jgi:curli biogenesis system outer membrane secretion channel CsgG